MVAISVSTTAWGAQLRAKVPVYLEDKAAMGEKFSNLNSVSTSCNAQDP